MNVIITEDYEEMSRVAFYKVLGKMLGGNRVNLSLTAGNTPKRLYELMIPVVKNKYYYNNVHYYNFDEIPIAGQRYGLTMTSLNKAYYEPCEIPQDNIHELNGNNYEGYDCYLKSQGGLDLILMGIGSNGHFCGNIPGHSRFHYETFGMKTVPGSEMYKNLEKLLGKTPGETSVTFGPRTVMQAKQLILFANGTDKAAIIKQALEGPVTEQVPASILKLHSDITVILDKEAASELSV